jgi:hypothetical protein
MTAPLGMVEDQATVGCWLVVALPLVGHGRGVLPVAWRRVEHA